MKGYLLYELEIILNSYCKSINDFGFPLPPSYLLNQLNNRLLMEEKNYNREELKADVVASVGKLTVEQKMIYNLIVHSSEANKQELIFVLGHGGT